MNPSLRAAAAAATFRSGSSTPCSGRRIPVACGVDSALADHRLVRAVPQRTRLLSPPFPSSRPADQRSLWLTTHSPAVAAHIFLTALACKLYVFINCMHHQVAVGAKSIMARCCLWVTDTLLTLQAVVNTDVMSGLGPKVWCETEGEGIEFAKEVPPGWAAHDIAPAGGVHKPLTANLASTPPLARSRSRRRSASADLLGADRRSPRLSPEEAPILVDRVAVAAANERLSTGN